VALGAVVLLWANDHAWKSRYPGVLTGKLSDVCGLVLFPLLLVGLIEIGCALLRRPHVLRVRAVGWAVLATGVVFAAIKVSVAAADAYRFAFGVRWMIERIVLGGEAVIPHVRHTVDPTDLCALPALAVPLLIARRVRGTPAARRGENDSTAPSA
jgi:hypothetical protein